jgi:ribonuclease HI
MESQKISLHTHSSVFECIQKMRKLGQSDRKVTMIWISSHVGIAGNEPADLGKTGHFG